MDQVALQQFISDLSKYLQNFCNGYVEFQNYVLITGQLFLRIDSDQAVEYVLNEKLCKIENEVNFHSSSFLSTHRQQQPAEELTPYLKIDPVYETDQDPKQDSNHFHYPSEHVVSKSHSKKRKKKNKVSPSTMDSSSMMMSCAEEFCHQDVQANLKKQNEISNIEGNLSENVIERIIENEIVKNTSSSQFNCDGHHARDNDLILYEKEISSNCCPNEDGVMSDDDLDIKPVVAVDDIKIEEPSQCSDDTVVENTGIGLYYLDLT